MTTGIVFDIKKFSIHDGPGIRTTVFLKGCPLSCWWCHNPEGQTRQPELILRPEQCIGCGACLDVCQHGGIRLQGDRVVIERKRCTTCGACVEVCYARARELVGRRMTVAEIVDEVKRDTAFYDESGGGVTISGGEPLSQPVFLRELLEAAKKEGVHTALDTCGFAPWNALESTREYVDLFLYDLKLMDDARHREVTGVSNEPILENLQKLSRCGHRIILRIPIIPGINDNRDSVRAIGTFAAALPHLEHVVLLLYHRIGRHKYRQLGRTCPMPDVVSPTGERIAEMAGQLRGYGLDVNVG